MVLCPDVVPFVDHRFDCRDLLQRSVIHYGTAKASVVTCAPRVGQSLRRHVRRAKSAARSRAAVDLIGRGVFECKEKPQWLDLAGLCGSRLTSCVMMLMSDHHRQRP